MYGQARLSLTRARPVLTIPTSAMIFNATGLQVATVHDGRAHFEPITVGRDLGTELEILTGLAPDEQVIANPNERIREGSPVKSMELDPPTPPAIAHAAPAETRPAAH